MLTVAGAGPQRRAFNPFSGLSKAWTALVIIAQIQPLLGRIEISGGLGECALKLNSV